MDNNHKTQVQPEVTAREIIQYLDRQYADRSEATKHRLLSDFLRSKKRQDESISQHLSKLKEKRAALRNLGEDHSEEFFQVLIINSLPPEYGDLLGQWETMHHSMKTTIFLESWLKQKEEKVKEQGPAMAVALTGSSRKPWDQMTIKEKKEVSKCKACNKKGHWAAECPKAKDDKGDKAGDVKTIRTNVIFNMGNLDPGPLQKWVLGSGATQHMCNTKQLFSELVLFEVPRQASVGDGKKIQVMGVGTVNIVAMVNGEKVTGTLSEVSYIPSLATNWAQWEQLQNVEFQLDLKARLAG